ncbi:MULTISPECIES: septation ring formation regulator EzrA [Gracilibacillus]|uniref:Septation ring formation regulator EzrA n=1 Tax=Gracilibacillus dipsosauri TaxID=178340 RepID=A0A317L4M8_9BACI|nr:septation ring formation regulator EzrA [Gracilibacillus dipsosauri]PWU70224.1 selenide, water dikinase [Gracilibacillus dipsosauri]
MEYLIGFILLIIALLILGLILRRKIYDHVDRLEEWKIDIMNRNVTEELSRVKKLNLLGETQQKFEAWKNNWDLIVTETLPDMEEDLMDVEEAANRFQIMTAKKRLQYIEEKLQSIEANIEEIFKDLNHLMDSEKYTRQQIEIVSPKLKELKKYLLHNRTQFGRAEIMFEATLTEMEKELQSFSELEEGGNYLAAQQKIDQIKEELEEIEQRISAFPSIYRKCRKEIPDQMNELIRDMEEMEAEGYRVEQFGFEKELKQYELVLKNSMRELEKAETAEINETLEQIEERLNEMELLLEQEEKSKSIVENQLPKAKQKTMELEENFLKMKEEVNELQQTYFIESSDLEMFLSVEKWLEKITNQFHQVEKDYEEQTSHHVEIKERLDLFEEEVDELEKAQIEFKEKVRDLRKDEIEAKDDIASIKQKLIQTNKRLDKSNIPGVPSSILNMLEEATEKCEFVIQHLQKHPLDMGKVQHALEEANKSVNNFVNQTNQILDKARLVEIAIQYGNRYRRKHPELASQLSEAEAMFRNYKYESAFELTIKALEQVDTNAMEKIEELDERYQEMLG